MAASERLVRRQNAASTAVPFDDVPLRSANVDVFPSNSNFSSASYRDLDDELDRRDSFDDHHQSKVRPLRLPVQFKWCLNLEHELDSKLGLASCRTHCYRTV